MKPAVWCVTYDGEMTHNLFLGEEAAKACLDRLNREYPADEARRAVVALAPAAAAVQGDTCRSVLAEMVKMMVDGEEHGAGSDWCNRAEAVLAQREASQDTVPTTVANQAINDALRLVSKDSERDAALDALLNHVVDDFREMNPSNYTHDEACDLNNWGIEAVGLAQAVQAAMAAQQEPKS